ncbi:unnamed protein product, partial [Prorocentrum cordatum]
MERDEKAEECKLGEVHDLLCRASAFAMPHSQWFHASLPMFSAGSCCVSFPRAHVLAAQLPIVPLLTHVDIICSCPQPHRQEGPDAEEKELDTQIEELIAATPPKATLTEEEKKLFFRKPKNPDLSPMLLSTSFASFTIPDKEEGLAEVKYEWYKAAKASSFLKEWVSSKKLTVRVEDLQPGEWFAKQ